MAFTFTSYKNCLLQRQIQLSTLPLLHYVDAHAQPVLHPVVHLSLLEYSALDFMLHVTHHQVTAQEQMKGLRD